MCYYYHLSHTACAPVVLAVINIKRYNVYDDDDDDDDDDESNPIHRVP